RKAVSANWALGFLYSTSTLQVPFTSSSFADVISKSSAPTATLTCSATLFLRSSKVRVGMVSCDLFSSIKAAHIRMNGSAVANFSLAPLEDLVCHDWVMTWIEFHR